MHSADLFNGLGFMLGGGFAGIDLDHVRDPENGVIIAWAARIIAAIDSYTEASISGTGVHILFRGFKPPGMRSNVRFDDGTAFECYDHGRFFVVTGDHIAGTPRELRDVSLVDLDGVNADVMARLPAQPPPVQPIPPPPRLATTPVTLDDSQLLERMFGHPWIGDDGRPRQARNGATIERLWHGQHSFGSPSDADLALCGSLAYWTDSDSWRIDRLFRQSSLMRPKWDDKRPSRTYKHWTIPAGTYGSQTIYLAIARCTSTFGGAARG